jgi:hypothetical protein
LDKQHMSNYVEELVEQDFPRVPQSIQELEQIAIEGQAALAELSVLKPVLALAISKLPKQQLKLSLEQQAKMDELEVQMKQESKSGAIVFRAVKA